MVRNGRTAGRRLGFSLRTMCGMCMCGVGVTVAGLVTDRSHDREKTEEGRYSPHGREPRCREMRVLIPTSRPCPEGPNFPPEGPT